MDFPPPQNPPPSLEELGIKPFEPPPSRPPQKNVWQQKGILFLLLGVVLFAGINGVVGQFLSSLNPPENAHDPAHPKDGEILKPKKEVEPFASPCSKDSECSVHEDKCNGIVATSVYKGNYFTWLQKNHPECVEGSYPNSGVSASYNVPPHYKGVCVQNVCYAKSAPNYEMLKQLKQELKDTRAHGGELPISDEEIDSIPTSPEEREALQGEEDSQPRKNPKDHSDDPYWNN